MMELSTTKVLAVCLIIGFLPCLSDALNCYQCNVFIRGTPWPCNSDRGMKEMTDCVACLKTYTRSYLHNTFHDVIMSTYESRVCVKDKFTARSSGCYNTVTGSGYMKRCFCHDHLCNRSSVISLSLTSVFGGLLVVFGLKYLS